MNILYPMFGMIFLSCLVVISLYISRSIMIYKVKIAGGILNKGRHAEEIRPNFPKRVRYITDNYNHLFEQPTLFYAIVIYIFLIGHTDLMHIYLAWGYVVFRTIHSCIQLSFNDVSWRIAFFVLSGICLIMMIVKEALMFLS
jgi:hypothetical protein